MDPGSSRVEIALDPPDGIEVRFTVTAGRVTEVERLRQGQVVERVAITIEGIAHSASTSQGMR